MTKTGILTGKCIWISLALQIWCRSASIYAISDINVIIGVVCSQLKPQRVWRSSLIFLVRWVSMTPRGAKPRRRWICQRKTTKMTASSRSDTSSFRTSTVWLYVTVHDIVLSVQVDLCSAFTLAQDTFSKQLYRKHKQVNISINKTKYI